MNHMWIEILDLPMKGSKKMIKKHIIISSIIMMFITAFSVYPWSDNTHNDISYQVEDQSNIIDYYLRNRLGFSGGNKTEFTIDFSNYTSPGGFESRFNLMHIVKRRFSALDWFVMGSEEEDTPLWRAFHHFHDPTFLELG